jgi:hypothetical protein
MTTYADPLVWAEQAFETAKADLAKSETEAKVIAAELALTKHGYHSGKLQAFYSAVNEVMAAKVNIERTRVALELTMAGCSNGESRSGELRSDPGSADLLNKVAALMPFLVNKLVGKPVMREPNSPEAVVIRTIVESLTVEQVAKLKGVLHPEQLISMMEMAEREVANLPKRCQVKDCSNHRGEGTFFGDLCLPCHTFITTGHGRNSQVYRNGVIEALAILKEAGFTQDPL